jgi:NAD+ synthase
MTVIKCAQFPKGPEYATNELAKQIIEMTAGAKGAVVGLSGGVDSTTVAYLCKYAFGKYGTKKLELHGLVMPSRANNEKDAKDGMEVAKRLGIKAKLVPIQPIADTIIAQMPEALQSDYDIGNLYSETRAVILSRYAAANNLRVMGTGNRDEDYVLGYFTKRGDGAVDNNILGQVPKRLVRELAAFLGVAPKIINKTPTAGLWAGQTDEGDLGYNYDQAEIIQNAFDQGMDAKEIAFTTCYDIRIVEDVAHRHKTTEHKRQPPPVGKVTLEYR